MLNSLRSRLIAGMALLIALVFALAVLAVTSLQQLDRAVAEEMTSATISTPPIASGSMTAPGASARCPDWRCGM